MALRIAKESGRIPVHRVPFESGNREIDYAHSVADVVLDLSVEDPGAGSLFQDYSRPIVLVDASRREDGTRGGAYNLQSRIVRGDNSSDAG